jgi:endo-1,4-beta-xylanase
MKLEDTSPQSLQRQAAIYSQIIQAAKTQPRFKGILQWGLYDKYNWLNDLPTEKVKPLHPLIYDVNCNPKPAYFALKESLSK